MAARCSTPVGAGITFSAHGVRVAACLYNEVRSALYDLDQRPKVAGFICGLGGREVTLDNVTEMSEILLKTARTGRLEQPNYWIGVRG